MVTIFEVVNYYFIKEVEQIRPTSVVFILSKASLDVGEYTTMFVKDVSMERILDAILNGFHITITMDMGFHISMFEEWDSNNVWKDSFN